MGYTVSTAGVAVSNNRFFVAKRNPGTSIGELWEFPGGKTERGEKPVEALVREFKEEFDADIKVGRLLCSGLFTNKGNTYRLKAYRIEILSENLKLNEHSETAWVEKNKLQELKFPASDMIIVNYLLNRRIIK